eukprot:366305-Chlamydomonas_euryale.AAC.10
MQQVPRCYCAAGEVDSSKALCGPHIGPKVPIDKLQLWASAHGVRACLVDGGGNGWMEDGWMQRNHAHWRRWIDG